MGSLPRKPRVPSPDLKLDFRQGSLLKAILLRRPTYSARVLDCSEGGMRLTVSKPLEIGESVQLTVEAASMPAPLLLEAKVLRCKGSGASYEVGLQIVKQGQAYARLLKRLLGGK